jgi:hypothetical protein
VSPKLGWPAVFDIEPEEFFALVLAGLDSSLAETCVQSTPRNIPRMGGQAGRFGGAARWNRSKINMAWPHVRDLTSPHPLLAVKLVFGVRRLIPTLGRFEGIERSALRAATGPLYRLCSCAGMITAGGVERAAKVRAVCQNGAG